MSCVKSSELAIEILFIRLSSLVLVTHLIERLRSDVTKKLVKQN